MKQRRRVTLAQSFREMYRAEKGVPSGGQDSDVYIGVPLAFWYWIVGVPCTDASQVPGAAADDETWEARDRRIWSDGD
jgi:hypothetical protein